MFAEGDSHWHRVWVWALGLVDTRRSCRRLGICPDGYGGFGLPLLRRSPNVTASEDGAVKFSHWDASDGRTLT